MQSWVAQQKMEDRVAKQVMDSINYMITGNHQATPNQTGSMPWGKGGHPGGKGGSNGGGKGGKANGKGGGGKGGKATATTPGPCRGCGGLHFRSECPAFINQTICQNCFKPGHLKSHCHSTPVDDTTICKCCGEAGHTKKTVQQTRTLATAARFEDIQNRCVVTHRDMCHNKITSQNCNNRNRSSKHREDCFAASCADRTTGTSSAGCANAVASS